MSDPYPSHQIPGKQWRLRWRLTFALVVLFGAIFAISALSHFQKLNDQKDSRVAGMQQVERTVAAVLDGFTSDLESFSLSTAITLGDSRLPIEEGALDQEAQANVNGFLSHLFDSYGILRSIFVTDPTGKVVYGNSGENAGLDLSDRSYVKALQDGADSFWSEGFPGLVSGRTIVGHSRRIVTPEGETSGFLIIAFYPDQLAARLPPGIAGEGHISLVDQQGQLLLQLPEPEGGTPLDALTAWPELETARSGEEVVIQAQDVPLTPGDRYVALGAMSRVDWVVGYSLPSSAIEGQANAIFQRDLLLLAALMIGGLALTLYMAHRVSQPLTRLGNVAQAIARGEKADELAEVKTSEADLASLANAMRYMKDAILSREEQLSTQAAVLESIERMGESLASELDLERAVSAVIEAGVKLTSAEASLFLYRNETGQGFEPAGRSGLAETGLALDSLAVAEVLSGQAVHIADLESRYEGQNGNGATAPPVTSSHSVLGIPIRFRNDEIIGALFLTHSERDAFSLQDMRVARGLARWAGIVLENAELYRRSQEVQELLRQANEDKDEFLAMVSHELRTPITTIYGGSRLLHLRRPILNEAAIADMIASVAEEAEQLYFLVEDLLALARTETSARVEREPVSVAQVLPQVVHRYARGHSRSMEPDVPDTLPPVLADPTYLTQVVSNLLSNADKYTPSDLPVEIKAWQDGREVLVRVKDHGPGVPEAELDQIFERFFRSSQTASTASGKGLGLTVCKRLVEAMDGRIWAQNAPEGGLEVMFTLAVAEEEEAEPAVEEALGAAE